MADLMLEVLAERRRQITAEGWTPEHDDRHIHGQLKEAADCYLWIASASDDDRSYYAAGICPVEGWPWGDDWWKPTTRRRDLIKAAALYLAEADRIGRIAASLDEGK